MIYRVQARLILQATLGKFGHTLLFSNDMPYYVMASGKHRKCLMSEILFLLDNEVFTVCL